MRLIHRYIVREFFLPFVYCITIFIFLCTIIDLFNHLDEILKRSIPFSVLFEYYSAFVPIIFVQTAPVAALLSTMYIMYNFNKANEITAMKASGISLPRIIQPLLFLGLIISITAFAVNDKFVPQAAFTASRIKQEKMEVKKKQKTAKLLYDVATFGTNNRMYYARSYDITQKKLNQLIVLEHDKLYRLHSKITVEEAKWEGGYWKAREVIEYQLDPKSGQVTGDPLYSKETILDIDEKPADFLFKDESQPEFMNTRQLKNYIRRISGYSERAVRRLTVDLYYRASFPFISLVIVLLGIPFAMKTQRGGKIAGIGLGIGLCFCYYTVMAVCVALGKGGTLPPFLAAWLANILFAGLAIAFLRQVPT